LTVAAACADLIFGARVRAAAEAAGWQALLISPRDAAANRIRTELPRLVLLDLDARWLDAVALIAALKADPATAAIPVVAFASHVRTDALAAAREAGADRVLARSAFVRQLPELLRVPAT
jgi:CheY-like chemotaxis protein